MWGKLYLIQTILRLNSAITLFILRPQAAAVFVVFTLICVLHANNFILPFNGYIDFFR